MLQVFGYRIILAECRPFAWMRHQADTRDDRIRFVVALKATPPLAQYSDTIVRPNLIEWQIDFVFDRKLIQSEAKVTEHCIDSARHRCSAKNATSNRPHETIALDPAVTTRFGLIVKTQTAQAYLRSGLA